MTFTTMLHDINDRPKPLKKGEPHGRALVLFAHGKGYVLAWDGDEGVANWISESGTSTGEPFACKHCIDHGKLADGVYIGELGWQNDGPSDWPGAGDEYSLCFEKERLASAEEWQHHLDDEWPWEPMRDD